MKLKIFQRNAEKNLSFCYNLTQPYGKCIYCALIEYIRHRLEIIQHTGAHSQNKTKRLKN